VHLLNLKDSASRNFVILFGGTWCPNTRAVIKDVNAEAQDNNVKVYNFDTVLDGGTVGGATTSAVNPLQIRNTANNGGVLNANPSFLYGSVVSTYFKNIVTQYDNGTYITYFPNGDTTKAVLAVRKLQVPFLINYQRGTANNVPTATIKRQWIQQKTDATTGLPTFTEYMTQYRFARPSAGRIGLSNSQFPLALTIPGLAGFNWKSPVYPDRATNADAAAYLDPAATDATTTPSALAAALSAVPGSSSLVTVADASAALTAAQNATPVDASLVANLTIIKADWTLVQARKNNVSSALANTAFGLESVAKLGTFFDGLPGGVASTQTVTAPDVAFGVAPTVTVAIANDYGRVPTGTVTLTANGETYTQAVANNAVSFTLPVLAAGSYNYTLSYPGDDQVLAFSRTGSFSVAEKLETKVDTKVETKVETPIVKTAVSSIIGAVGTAPTLSTGGTYGVSIATPAGKVAATGPVTVTVASGATSATFTGTLSGGSALVALPKLAAGNWSVAVAWAGDANYLAASTTGSITVAKATAKIAGAVSVKPTSKKAGKYAVTVTSPAGLDRATGKVTVKVKNGSTTKTLTGKLSNGTATVTVPKLKKGTWSVAISYPGDTTLAAGTAKGTLKVAK